MANSQEEVAEELIDAFETFDSWDDRYSFLIDLGRKLPPLDPAEKNEDNRVHGCQSNVWMVARVRLAEPENEIEFIADSDAAIVKGLIAILRKIYSGQPASRILSFDIDALLQRLELGQHLSMNRGNGLQAMIKRIKTLAAQKAARPEN